MKAKNILNYIPFTSSSLIDTFSLRNKLNTYIIYRLIIFIVYYLNEINYVSSQLTVNIKNNGGEIFKETINANTSKDIIQLEYMNTDGSLVTQFIDFYHEIQIFRLIWPGEEERGDKNAYQAICFVISLNKNEFISADAMSKLRQRNPGTIRQAEDDKGLEFYLMNLMIDTKKSSIISAHIANLCDNLLNVNSTQILTRDIDIETISKSKVINRDLETLLRSVNKLSERTDEAKAVRCNLLIPSDKFTSNEMDELFKRPCQCQLNICIPWYPCLLKFCKGKDTITGKTINYRCGIHTCRKCRLFRYMVNSKQNCLWDI